MNSLGVTVVLGLLVGAWAQLMVPLVMRPPCDSDEAEGAALAAQEYLNAQHSHFYKYALNQVEDIKVLPKANGDNIYFLEVELLETDCHVLDPTPVANCTVRPRVLTAVEGDCDVVLKKVGGILTVTAFKCKTDESREDLCFGCPTLLPLNNTAALDFVSASLVSINEKQLNQSDVLFALLEIGRMSTQMVSGEPIYIAEYAIVEANCTGGNCVPLAHNMAQRGFCTARGSEVACNLFPALMTYVDANTTDVVPAQPPVNILQNVMTVNHGLRHHKLTTIHDPELSGLLSESEESSEVSSEVVPVVPAVFVPVTPAVFVPVAPAVPEAVAPAAAEPEAVAPAAAEPEAVAPADPEAVAPAAAEPEAVAPAAAEPEAVAPAAAEPEAVAPEAAEPAAASDAEPVVLELAALQAAPAALIQAAPAALIQAAPAALIQAAPAALIQAVPVPHIQAVPVPLMPQCPGKKKFF